MSTVSDDNPEMILLAAFDHMQKDTINGMM